MNSEKEQLIMVATDLFSRHGFHAFDVDRILAEAAVARMTLYNHFLARTILSARARPPSSRTRLIMPSYRNRSWLTRSLCDAPPMVVTRQGMRLG